MPAHDFEQDASSSSHPLNLTSNFLSGSDKDSRVRSRRSKNIAKRQAHLPRRLSDDLRWRCSACQSLVPTKETHFHLLGCLMTLVNPNSFGNSLFSGPTCKCSSIAISDATERPFMEQPRRKEGQVTRPRTKRLERPTPGVKHPVIYGSGDLITTSCCNCEHPNVSNGLDSPISTIPLALSPLQSPFLFKSRSLAKLDGPRPTARHDAPTCKSCNRAIGSLASDESWKKTGDTAVEAVGPRRKVLEKIPSTTKSLPVSREGIAASQTTRSAGCKEEDTTKAESAHQLSKNASSNKNKSATTMAVSKKSSSDRAKSYPKGADAKGWEHFKAQLVPCPRCRRTFYRHRLEAHKRTCDEDGARISQLHNSQGDSSTAVIQLDKHKARNESHKISICPKCSEVFSGTKELRQHTAMQCTYKGQPPKESEPLDPEWVSHLQTLKACRRCKRTFIPDRLMVHEPNCKAEPLSDSSS